MCRLMFTVALCAGLLALCGPAAADPGDVYPGDTAGGVTDPGDIKAAFDHYGEPKEVDHDGNWVSNINPVPWYWHPAEDMVNVAGFRFSVHYDSYEAMVGLRPAGKFTGHSRVQHNPPIAVPPPQSTGGPSAKMAGTVWLNHPDAQESGIQVTASVPVHIFNLAYNPRHTSEVSNPEYNSDIDIKVTQLTPIFHVPANAHTGSFWKLIPGDAGTPDRLVHQTSVPGVWVPNSVDFYGPINSLSAPQPRHVQNTVHIPNSVTAHAYESSVTLQTKYHKVHWTTKDPSGAPDSEIWVPPSYQFHLLGSTNLTGQLINPSSFIVGAPVLGDLSGTGGTSYGLGIDHVPEPATLALLGMAGLALFVQTRIRRRRRRTA